MIGYNCALYFRDICFDRLNFLAGGDERRVGVRRHFRGRRIRRQEADALLRRSGPHAAR